MNRWISGIWSARRSQIAGCWVGFVLLGLGAASNGQEAKPLARYVPLDGLSILVENDGLASNPKAWKATSMFKMLNETTLGVMLEDITTQLIDRGLQSAPGLPVTGKELTGLLEHLAGEGFVIGYCGSLNPPQPKALVIVIRNAAKNPVFKKLVAQLPPLNEPAATKINAPGGRTVWQLNGPPLRWWYEKDDAVFSFAPPGGPDPVLAVLEGKAASALKSPIWNALLKGEPGEVPISQIFVDLSALPPLPPQAAALGLDAITRFEARLAILDKGIVSAFGVQAPRPRKGILALLDQPAIGSLAKLVYPPGVTDSALVSIDLAKTGDAILALMKANDPESASKATAFSDQFKAKTGLSFRNDLVAKIGPRMAVLSPGGAGFGSIYGMWFSPPESSMVAELKDAKGFATTLDKLMVIANRELKAAGGMVPPQPGQAVKPGTSFAEFRKLAEPERGYVLAIPPAVLPTPAGFRPTVIVDASKGLIALGTSPASARKALGSLVLDGGSAKSPRDPGAVALAQSDPSKTVPALLVNLPSLVQVIGFAAAQPNAQNPQPVGPPLRLQIDPDAIPTADSLRPYFFPSRFTMAVDDASIRFSAFQAFPVHIPELSGGMEAPVLIALLLPAVQAAREAARRSQCVNNMKQMGLAFHNFHDANGGFPASAIVDKDGKPLLSWRVAILPFIEQQELYNKFKLDEPWDSPNNKALIAQMPNIYACPSSTVPPGQGLTTYKVFNGPGALLDEAQPTGINQITDGTSNTILVVESSSDPVPWTKPEDLPFAIAAQPQAPGALGIGSKHPGGFNALMADGSVKFIKLTVNRFVLQALITKAGGEVIAADAY
jgi:prepilin-type processing-associated H-X9-DG protein